MVGVSAISGSPSMNQLLAGMHVAQAARKLRAADADIRAQALRAQSEAGYGAQSGTQIRYTVGPDGQLYARSATVTTSRRGEGVRDPLELLGVAQQENGPLTEALRENLRDIRPLSFTDILNPKPQLSPTDEVVLFGTQPAAIPGTTASFREDAFQSMDGLNLSRLQVSDFGVRAQEGQHFRAAGGLGSLPEYDYQRGPDGKLYAVAGHVGISERTTTDPEQAARDENTVAAAALAATDVSAQDVAVARNAQSRAAGLYAQNNALINRQDPVFSLAA